MPPPAEGHLVTDQRHTGPVRDNVRRVPGITALTYHEICNRNYRPPSFYRDYRIDVCRRVYVSGRTIIKTGWEAHASRPWWRRSGRVQGQGRACVTHPNVVIFEWAKISSRNPDLSSEEDDDDEENMVPWGLLSVRPLDGAMERAMAPVGVSGLPGDEIMGAMGVKCQSCGHKDHYESSEIKVVYTKDFRPRFRVRCHQCGSVV